MKIQLTIVISITAIFAAAALVVIGSNIGSNQAQIAPELITNGGFENYPTTPGFPPGWSCYVPDFSQYCSNSVELSRDSIIKNSGQYSLKFTADGSSTLVIANQLPIVYKDTIYHISGYIRTGVNPISLGLVAGGNAQSFGTIISNNGIGTIQGLGTHHEVLLIASGVNTFSKFDYIFLAEKSVTDGRFTLLDGFGPNNGEFIFSIDDVSVTLQKTPELLSTQALLNLVFLAAIAIIVLGFIGMTDKNDD